MKTTQIQRNDYIQITCFDVDKQSSLLGTVKTDSQNQISVDIHKGHFPSAVYSRI